MLASLSPLLAAVAGPWQQGLGVLVIVLAIWAVARQLEVRLIMLLAGLLLALLAGRPQTILETFLATFADEQYVVPLCTAMGFAHVLRLTGCDQHLVHLLVRPLLRVRPLLIPGTVVVGFLVNMPIVSQTSTAATLGPVVIPILRAARISPATIGAALVLGCSIGGELLNPGAPEIQTVVVESQSAARQLGDTTGLERRFTPETCVRRIMPLDFANLAVVTLLFWALSLRQERRSTIADSAIAIENEKALDFHINPIKAVVPLLPLLLLYLTSKPLEVVHVPRAWLVGSGPGPFETRLVGAAMLLGAAVAALVSPGQVPAAVRAFCEGAGYAFAHIISLITAARCFGRGLKVMGFDALLGQVIRAEPGWLLPAAGALPLGFAVLCGSGIATTQSLFGFFAAPALDAHVDPTHVGALVALASAAGRSMSPVSAVALVVSTLTGTHPLQLVRRTALPALLALIVTIIIAIAIAPPP